VLPAAATSTDGVAGTVPTIPVFNKNMAQYDTETAKYLIHVSTMEFDRGFLGGGEGTEVKQEGGTTTSHRRASMSAKHLGSGSGDHSDRRWFLIHFI